MKKIGEFRYSVLVGDCNMECDIFKLENNSWKCIIPNDMPIIYIAEIMMDFFGMKDMIQIKSIEIGSDKTEISAKSNVN